MASDESSALSRPLEGISVLVVEDYEDARTLFATLLAMTGASVTAVGSVPDAVNALDRATFDVVVSDLNIPEQDGFDLIRHLRALPRQDGRVTPAVAISALEEDAYRSQALDAGFQDFLPKPVDAADLVEVIAGLVRRRVA
jgi:CheY-like chemotaxis protein